MSLNLTKDKKTGTWLVQFYFTDWQGKKKKKFKRGFRTKAEASQWAMDFLQQQQSDLDMVFEKFVELYYEDIENRLKKTTMRTKKYIIDLKILPYFKDKRINDIKAADIRKWQNKLLNEGFSPTYLKTINNQLVAIINYAERYYDLKNNPCKKAGTIGKSKAEEMLYWTKDEYLQFIEGVKDKPMSYMAFQILYWTGMRIGELLALTFTDIDFENRKIIISKTYTRLEGEDMITTPKTPKSNRKVSIPKFLAEELQEYTDKLYGVMANERIFHCTSSYMNSEMKRGVTATGVKKIRLHDLRHSHASLLVEMGVAPLEMAKRLGHEKIETTLNTYSHLYPNKQALLADRLDSEFEKMEDDI
jgi:integrase